MSYLHEASGAIESGFRSVEEDNGRDFVELRYLTIEDGGLGQAIAGVLDAVGLRIIVGLRRDAAQQADGVDHEEIHLQRGANDRWRR